jgi:hypothetical protein
MKKLFLLASLMLLLVSVASSQMWFQASIEHKFNKTAGLSASNEIGYNFNFPNNSSIAPSVDYTYFSDGNVTQTLLFECLTATYLFPIKDCDIVPYVSITGSHLEAFLSPGFGDNVKHQENFGGSFQIGAGFMANKNTQLFFQYRYFTYGTLLYGQLTQFGFMYTFGG